MVDYIFYSTVASQKPTSQDGRREGSLKLLGRLGLTNSRQMARVGNIPNQFCPSDHLPLVADFLLSSQKTKPELNSQKEKVQKSEKTITAIEQEELDMSFDFDGLSQATIHPKIERKSCSPQFSKKPTEIDTKQKGQKHSKRLSKVAMLEQEMFELDAKPIATSSKLREKLKEEEIQKKAEEKKELAKIQAKKKGAKIQAKEQRKLAEAQAKEKKELAKAQKRKRKNKLKKAQAKEKKEQEPRWPPSELAKIQEMAEVLVQEKRNLRLLSRSGKQKQKSVPPKVRKCLQLTD